MKESIQMILVLSLICAVCALGLSGFRSLTAERIEEQQLINVQGPAVTMLLDGSDNDLIAGRQALTTKNEKTGREETSPLFIGKKGDEVWAVAFETKGKGFGGDITVMAAYDLASDKLLGIQITAHSETPGVGDKVGKDAFTSKFKGLAPTVNFKVAGDGGDVDGVSGATVSSRGVCEALRKSVEMYPGVKKTVKP